MTIYFLQGVNPAPTPVAGRAMAATTVLATFADPDAVAGLSATVNWGDSTTSAATISLTGSVFVPGIGNVPEYAVEAGHTYAASTNGSTLPIHVTVNDAADATNLSIFDSTQVLPAFVPFQVTASPLVVSEGEVVPAGTMVGTVSFTPGAETPNFTGTVFFPGAATSTPLNAVPEGVNFFLLATATATSLDGFEEGTYTDSVVVTDANNGNPASNTDTAIAPFTIADAPLVLNGPQPTVTATQGTALVDVPVASFADLNSTAPLRDFSATVDWGDGTSPSAGRIVQPGGPGTPFTVEGSHTFDRATATSYPVTVAIRDLGGSSLNTSTTAAVAASTVVGSVADFVAVEGQPLNNVVVATFTDPGGAGTIGAYSATINWGVGNPTTGTIVPVGGNEFAVEGSFTYPEENVSPGIPYPVTVTIQHNDPPVSTTTTVDSSAFVDDAPLFSKAAPVSGVEGTPLPGSTVVAAFLDQNRFAGASDFLARINWGDGTSSTGAINVLGGSTAGSTFTVTGSHTYTDKGNYQTSVLITDVGGSTTTDVGNAAIADAPATASPIGFTTTVDQQFSGPVAFFFQNYGAPTGLQPGSNYTTTINWGDGSAPSLGTIVPVSGGFDVVGVHTYLLSRTTAGSNMFPVTVSIHDNGGAVVTVVGTAMVNDVPLIGHLNPASDTGLSNTDGITRIAQPDFFGTGEAYATIQLFAAPAGTTGYQFVGQASTDSSGAWSITSSLLADGKYTILAREIDGSGTIIAADTILPNAGQGPLVIDTAGPRVTSVSLDRLHGRVVIDFSDNLSGLDYAELDNSANYLFGRRGAPVTAYQVTGIFARSTAADPESEVILTINGGRPLRGGVYNFTIFSGSGATGVRDVAGNAMDGEFYGTFPSGDGRPGGDFVSVIDTVHHLIYPPRSVIGTVGPLGPGTTPPTTYIPTVNPRHPLAPQIAAIDRQLALLNPQAARAPQTLAAQAARAHAAAKLAAHDAALAHASARARRA